MDTQNIQMGWYETQSGVRSSYRNILRKTRGNTANTTQAVNWMDDISSVEWNNIEDITPDFSIVTFNLGGNAFSVFVGQEYPRERPVLMSGVFPDQDYPWSASDDLRLLCLMYIASIAKHQLYFQV